MNILRRKRGRWRELKKSRSKRTVVAQTVDCRF